MYLFKPPEFGTDFVLLFIYIPLCIYFNYDESTETIVFAKFTFHYVSISTTIKDRSEWILANLHSTMYLFQQAVFNALEHAITSFTFHYVSISTLCQTLPISHFQDLHSTMYLFQLGAGFAVFSGLIIYIPLCIYFNYYMLDLIMKLM